VVSPTVEQIRAMPKVLLHDHLDGGLRPETVIDLADDIGYSDLPTRDPAELTQVLTAGAHRGHLNLYLDAFRHTVGVMQTRHALYRVAREAAEDLADDGIVYAEVRFAPELHTELGLTLDEVVHAVLDGFSAGSEDGRIKVRALLTAMRTAARSRRSPSSRSATVTTASSASTSRAPRRAGHQAVTWTRFSTSTGRTSTSRSTPARATACLPSGRPFSTAAPSV
jgi:hypothetical protein